MYTVLLFVLIVDALILAAAVLLQAGPGGGLPGGLQFRRNGGGQLVEAEVQLVGDQVAGADAAVALDAVADRVGHGRTPVRKGRQAKRRFRCDFVILPSGGQTGARCLL